MTKNKLIFVKIVIMKNILFFLTILLFAQVPAQSIKVAGPPAGEAMVGDYYGAAVSLKSEKDAITPAKLNQKLKSRVKMENIAVKGKVTEVCDKKGCWMTIETENKEKFFVKMKDYSFFVPTALVGKNVILEGNAEAKIISVEEQQHYAEDAKKSKEEIAAITNPKEEIRFMASGIKVVR